MRARAEACKFNQDHPRLHNSLIVERVTFHNLGNGLWVLRLKARTLPSRPAAIIKLNPLFGHNKIIIICDRIAIVAPPITYLNTGNVFSSWRKL